MSLRLKIVLASLGAMLSLSGSLLFMNYHHTRDELRRQTTANARTIVLAAEATHTNMAEKWDMGLFDHETVRRWADAGEIDKVLAAVPVFAAWKTAKSGATEQGYEFRTPKLSPRNPRNEPDQSEARVLVMLKQTGAEEHSEIDESMNAVRFYRPVVLTQNCMACHGDPSQSMALWGNDKGLDPTGAKMEGWKVGEIHGAFEVIQSLDAADAMLVASFKDDALVMLGILILGTALIYWLVTSSLLRRIDTMSAVVKRVGDGDLSTLIDVTTHDEIGELEQSFNATIGIQREVVSQARCIAQGDFSTDIHPRGDNDELGMAVFQMTRNLRDVVNVCEAVAIGDFTAQVEIKGERDALGKTINQMIENLRLLVGEIDSAGANMVSASRDQASGAKDQSVATEEMTSTVSELLASARTMTGNAGTVAEQADLAATECAGGTSSVERAVLGIKGIHERVERIAAHMVELGTKSQQVSGVLDIITELSEQTNLLSLNASIEAAGAGEAGKRFAVVATEIRKLAERATESTGEIRNLIDGVQETVNSTIMATEEGTKAVAEGVRLTEDVDQSFVRINGQVTATTQSAKAIEMGSRQQATAIEQLEAAVKSVDQAARRTEETSRSLDENARALLSTARRLQNADHELQTA